jgi:3-hydroxyisobutyrate dehydrogenase-like beta-hydroxyacid dehydrogenase
LTAFPTRLAIVGFGEVGQIFARQFADAGVGDIAVYDIVFPDANAQQTRAASTGPWTKCASAHDATMNADVVVSAVTAAGASDAAMSAVMSKGAFFWDLNSVSPETKIGAADIIEKVGGRYVEAAIMSSVPPKGIRSPMLLGGPHARDFMAQMAPFNLDLTAFSEEIGTASAVKMCRSILIKGLEALIVESMLAARHYGVEREVLVSLKDSLPHPDWPKQAAYMISRALIHGRRRAEEMREVAATVFDAGLEPVLSRQIAQRQDWAADKGAGMSGAALKPPDLDKILAELLKLAKEQAS